MPSAFDSDFDAANDLFADVFGEQVTLVRGLNSTADVTASWLGQGSEIQTHTRMGAKTSFIDREWLIDLAAYVIDDTTVTPAAGDRIVDSSSVTWELMSHPDVPASELYAGGNEWLLRTKRIAT